MCEKDTITLEIPKGMDDYGFIEKMLRELVKDIVASRDKNTNNFPTINLQIQVWRDDNDDIKVNVHEGDYTAFIPAVSTCMTDQSCLYEFTQMLIERIKEVLSSAEAGKR